MVNKKKKIERKTHEKIGQRQHHQEQHEYVKHIQRLSGDTTKVEDRVCHRWNKWTDVWQKGKQSYQYAYKQKPNNIELERSQSCDISTAA